MVVHGNIGNPRKMDKETNLNLVSFYLCMHELPRVIEKMGVLICEDINLNLNANGDGISSHEESDMPGVVEILESEGMTH